MRIFKFVSLVMLIWGSQAFASRPAEGGDLAAQVREIYARTAHLNRHYDLNVSVPCPLNQGQTASIVIEELIQLESLMRGEARQPMDPLKHLACTRPECGGGSGGGGCRTCYVPDDIRQGQDSL